ncbi:AlpA family transcriptional regulator [Picosynechococcus sp. NKBG042902]|uniref:helix-turn-helix transcriptional regulator n=1 Tax=Picosynechococcus sp. NKBG042902 TaxID=490193 RepID=UPI001CB796B0|nr:DNA-binding protein [Picosynechococcus sp. NKBG042902]
MKYYNFELSFRLPGVNTNPEQYLDALFEAGCDDAMIGIGRNGFIGADFSRESESLELAVESAIKDIESAIPGAVLIEAGPDLVGASDIAAILGCSRQNIRQHLTMADENGPIPVYQGKRDLWHLAEVLIWLRDAKGLKIEPELIEVAAYVMTFNSNCQSKKPKSSGPGLIIYGQLQAFFTNPIHA